MGNVAIGKEAVAIGKWHLPMATGKLPMATAFLPMATAFLPMATAFFANGHGFFLPPYPPPSSGPDPHSGLENLGVGQIKMKALRGRAR